MEKMVEHEIHSEWRRDIAVDESVEKQAGVNLYLRGDCHYLEHGDEVKIKLLTDFNQSMTIACKREEVISGERVFCSEGDIY